MRDNFLGFELKLGQNGFEVESLPIGQSTGSNYKDFYVYEWFLVDTGQIFYVGKGRENRAYQRNNRNYETNKIIDTQKVDVKFIRENLTEEEAIKLETEELKRLLNDPRNIISNTIKPIRTKWNPIDHSLLFSFEESPNLINDFSQDYDKAFFEPMDTVDESKLGNVHIDTSYYDFRIRDIIYNGDSTRYYEELLQLLEINKSKIFSTITAKSIDSIIVVGIFAIDSAKYYKDQHYQKTGKTLEIYHLLDVLKYLRTKFSANYKILNNINNQSALINADKPKTSFKDNAANIKLYYEGENYRKKKDFKKAVEYFNKAREQGYQTPYIYESYAKMYRDLGEYEKEIEVLEEAIEYIRGLEIVNQEQLYFKFKERLSKAIELAFKNRT